MIRPGGTVPILLLLLLQVDEEEESYIPIESNDRGGGVG